MTEMPAPKLNKEGCSVLIAELATGHVYKKDFTLYIGVADQKDLYQIFDGFKEAQDFALDLIKRKPEYECVIYNHFGQHIITYDKSGERNPGSP
jgi:hypothetical protein